MTIGASIAIVGAGFTGSLLAVHLLRQARGPMRIELIDKRQRFGRGLAYGTGNVSHLLNVRASNMSAFPDDPCHFVDWLAQEPGASGAESPGGYAFVPRAVYGTYLAEQLDQAVAAAEPGAECAMVVGTANDLTRDEAGFTLHLDTGRVLRAETVALCLGNFPPQLPCELPSDVRPGRVVADPWAEGALAAVPKDAAVLILGTGLTMVDVVLGLLDQGHTGTITALSRRGLLPHRHTNAAPYRDFLGERGAPSATAAGILHTLRSEVRAAAARGENWRSVVDAARPHLHRLWARLPLAERRRFLRHARPYWEIHRHRMAPDVAARIDAARKAGQLKIRAGRMKEIRATGETLLAAFRPRAANTTLHLKADVLINCAGPESNFALVRDPLVHALLRRGLIRPDPLGLGIETTPDGEVIGEGGRPIPGLLALGPIARGAYWEMTAVPELRCVCAATGRRLAGLAAVGR